MKRKADHKKKLVTITMAVNYKSTAPIPAFIKAARKSMKGLNHHFKVDGWDLDYNVYVADIFYDVYGHHLENYLLNELFRAGKYVLKSGKRGGLVIARDKKRKPKRGKNK